MRSLVIRTIILLFDFLLFATAVHLMSMMIAQLFQAYSRRYRRLPMVEFLRCHELQHPKVTD